MSIAAAFKPGKGARAITAGDMDLALEHLPPAWRVDREGSAWQVTLRKVHPKLGVTHEMAMWADDDASDVSIGGFDDDVIAILGQFLADRAGPQIFEDDAGSDPIAFEPRKGTKRAPAPKPRPKRRVTEARQVFRVVPLDVLVEDLDPLARATWLQVDDMPPSRLVTVTDVEAVARKQGWQLAAKGSGARWKASLGKIALAIDGKHVTIETTRSDPRLHTLGSELADLAGPQCMVVGDAAVICHAARRR